MSIDKLETESDERDESVKVSHNESIEDTVNVSDSDSSSEEKVPVYV